MTSLVILSLPQIINVSGPKTCWSRGALILKTKTFGSAPSVTLDASHFPATIT